MKLYTEEQVRFIYNCYDFNLDQDGSCIIDEYKYFKQKLEELTPIELPSDEEIDKMFYKSEKSVTLYDLGYMDGAKWMKEQILNQNK